MKNMLINTNFLTGTNQVDELWNEIRNDYEYVEFIQDPKQRKYGIGVLINK
jgi:hypothetical protein